MKTPEWLTIDTLKLYGFTNSSSTRNVVNNKLLFFEIYSCLTVDVWFNQKACILFVDKVRIDDDEKIFSTPDNFCKYVTKQIGHFTEGENQFTFIEHKLRFSVDGSDYTTSKIIYRKLESGRIFYNNREVTITQYFAEIAKIASRNCESIEAMCADLTTHSGFLDSSVAICLYDSHTISPREIELFLVDKLKDVISRGWLPTTINMPSFKKQILQIYKTEGLNFLNTYKALVEKNDSELQKNLFEHIKPFLNEQL